MSQKTIVYCKLLKLDFYNYSFLKGKISETLGKYLHIFNLLCTLVVPCTVVLTYQPPPCKCLD